MKPEGDESDFIKLGRISGHYGIRGWLKIYSYSRPRENIFSYQPLWTENRHGVRRQLFVADWKQQGKTLLAGFEGIEDRDAALKLIGQEIGIPRHALPALPEGEYYWCDLLGLEVVNEQGQLLGSVAEVRETGANDVLVVKGEEKILVPVVKGQVLKDVNLAEGRILVDWSGEFL